MFEEVWINNGAVWANTSLESSVQYNTNNTSTYTGGVEMDSGYLQSTNQTGQALQLSDGVFTYQLERNSFSNTPFTFTLIATASVNSANIAGSITWHEIT